MLTGKENTLLLEELLKINLAPQSVQQIKRARKNFKDVRGVLYPVAEADFTGLVVREIQDGIELQNPSESEVL